MSRRAFQTEKTPLFAGPFPVRRRGLEPPPGYLPDQALNLIRDCTMLFVSIYAVDSVHAGEHIGRSG